MKNRIECLQLLFKKILDDDYTDLDHIIKALREFSGVSGNSDIQQQNELLKIKSSDGRLNIIPDRTESIAKAISYIVSVKMLMTLFSNTEFIGAIGGDISPDMLILYRRNPTQFCKAMDQCSHLESIRYWMRVEFVKYFSNHLPDENAILGAEVLLSLDNIFDDVSYYMDKVKGLNLKLITRYIQDTQRSIPDALYRYCVETIINPMFPEEDFKAFSKLIIGRYNSRFSIPLTISSDDESSKSEIEMLRKENEQLKAELAKYKIDSNSSIAFFKP